MPLDLLSELAEMLSLVRNVYSLEVELALQQTVPELAEVAVVGIPDAVWGEAVTAFVVLDAGERLDEADVIARGRTRLGGYKLPKRVVFCEQLPKSRNWASQVGQFTRME